MQPIETQRLRLRQWTEADLEPLARLNADPEVMRYFAAPLSRDESDAMAARLRAQIETKGWGLWAAERRVDGAFLGLVGLQPVPASLPFAPAVEVGWRLAREHWGCGYAKEAALASLAFAFEKLRLPQVVSFTAELNLPSRALMERLGMGRIEAFEHPALPAGSPLRPHVLYALRRGAWERTREGSARVGFPCGTFRAREVVVEELPVLQLFYEANPGYFRLVHGEPPAPDEARESLESLPPKDWPFTRKYLLAFHTRDDAIVAVADVVSDLFAPGVWHIGFFMAADAVHGTGVPHALYAHLEAWMRSQGARWLRLGVVRGNGRAERFWQKMGYIDVAERRDYVQGIKRHTLRVMAKAVAAGAWAEYQALVPRDREAAHGKRVSPAARTSDRVRLAEPRDAAGIAAIYTPAVVDSFISFETEAPGAAEMQRRIESTLAAFPWLVMEREGRLAGYAYASHHRERRAYRWSVDVSCYVHADFRRQRIGQALYGRLFAILRRQGFFNAYAGIALPNEASVRLHESMGFGRVGVYANVGYKHGAWRDVGWWALVLAPPRPDPPEPLALRDLGPRILDDL